MAFSYGDPSKNTNQLNGPRPPCWGTSKYDNEDRECRFCGFQNTCREQALKTRPPVTPAPQPVANYFSQYSAPSSYAAPQPVAPPQTAQIVPIRPAAAQSAPQVAPVRQVQVAPVQQQQGPPPMADRYGQFQDPLFLTLKSTPPVLRPQFPEEGFAERIAKNMVLASAEAALGEVLLGLRQFLWTPRNDKDK